MHKNIPVAKTSLYLCVPFPFLLKAVQQPYPPTRASLIVPYRATGKHVVEWDSNRDIVVGLVLVCGVGGVQ